MNRCGCWPNATQQCRRDGGEKGQKESSIHSNTQRTDSTGGECDICGSNIGVAELTAEELARETIEIDKRQREMKAAATAAAEKTHSIVVTAGIDPPISAMTAW